MRRADSSLFDQKGARLVHGGQVLLCQINARLLAEIYELLKQIHPRPWPLGNRLNHFGELFLRVASFVIASCLSSFQNFESTGIRSPDLKPSMSIASSWSLARRLWSARISSRTYSLGVL